MAHSYTPGLTVTERTVLRRRRLLPIPGSVLVQTGDRVQADQIVARAELPGPVHAVNVANLLGVAPDEIRDYLTAREGAAVRKDDVIAENKPFIKWLKTEVRAPVTGRIESVSTVTGQVLLREPPRLLELRGYVDGDVVEIQPRQGVTVETDCTLVQGIFGIGGETWGELIMVAGSPDATVTAVHLQPAMKGKIGVCGAFLGAEVMQRAGELGLAGLVVGGIHDRDLREVLGYDLGVAITGTECIRIHGERRVPLTVVLTEGFGTIPMAAETFDLLARHAGQNTSLSGATQIRAGVIRPELLIPRPPGAGATMAYDVVATAAEKTGIRIGEQARIIRDPLFGKIGQVTALPADLREIETESRVRVLEVTFPDGAQAVIPRANVEIIEGE
jgi:hypothetical protein